jgi:excisionase family DNA binding protein
MTRNDNAGQLLTPRHVAAALQFTTPRPVYRLIREGVLPASRIGGRLLIERSDVQALIAGARTRTREARPDD